MDCEITHSLTRRERSEMLEYLKALKYFGKPVLFLVRTRLIERNENIQVVDITTFAGFKYTLTRKGNEKADYVMLGFRLKPTQPADGQG